MTEQSTATTPRVRPGRRRWLTAALLLAAAVVLLTLAGGDATGPGAAPSGDRDPVLGAADAPVTLVEYSDFRCPFCARHATETKPEIVARYVDPGHVRYVWRDLPFQGEPSLRAALAGREAHAQGRFWAFHRALFASQDDGLSSEHLRRVATEAGLDLDAYDAAMADERHADTVREDVEEAQRLGLSGTPAFVVDGQVIVGAQPLEVFVEVLDAALAARG